MGLRKKTRNKWKADRKLEKIGRDKKKLKRLKIAEALSAK